MPEVFAEVLQEKKSQQASSAAKARHANSESGKFKEFVRDCWLEWQGDPKRYPSQAQFARDMLEKSDEQVESPVTIEKWCREWKKAVL